MYVKLFGGPLDGGTEGITPGTTGLSLNYPRYSWMLNEGETQTRHRYKQSAEDPQYFVYEGPDE